MARGVFPRDEHFMRLALREAVRAAEHGDVPIGCVVVSVVPGKALLPGETRMGAAGSGIGTLTLKYKGAA